MRMIKETIEYKDLRHSTGLEIEDLLGYAASYIIEDCENCAIKELCLSQSNFDCSGLWTKYLKGEIHGEA